jgi:hypothetical protein
VLDEAGPIDGQLLLSLAVAHGLSPLADRALGASLSEEVAAALRERAHTDGRRSALLAADMLELEAAFDNEGIAVVPFKGPALASRLYGNVALRPSVDLDFLIRRADVQRAAILLADIGFSGVPQLDELRMFLRSGNELTVTRSSDGLIAEIQWSPAPPYFSFPVRLDTMIDLARDVPMAHRSIRALRPEDELLLLLLHGSKHLWARLIWLTDIIRTLSSAEPLDWDAILQTAHDARATRVVLVGLRLALELRPDLPVPPEVRSALTRDRRIEEVAHTLKRRLLSRDPRDHEPPFRRLDLSLREDWRDKLTYCVRLATEPTIGDLHWLPLPEPYWWVYGALRPVRLGTKYLRSSSASDLD